MRVVFLDIDGVVSPFGLGTDTMFEATRMLRLKEILDATNARIVLSSSWRTTEFGRGEVNKQLAKVGIQPCLDVTPELHSSRATEILLWLQRHQAEHNVEGWVALDDIDLVAGSPDKNYFRQHAVHTNSNVGLTEACVIKAVELLANPP